MVTRSGQRFALIALFFAGFMTVSAPRASAQSSINFTGGGSIDPEQIYAGVSWSSPDLGGRFKIRPGIDGGFGDGLRLALNIGSLLLAFIALIALINGPLTWIGQATGLEAMLGKPTDLSTIFGYVLAPIAWVIGVPWQDATVVGSLIGQKVVINEFVAYLQLADIVNGKVPGVLLSDQGKLIATYALCGFANFSSIAIQIGGIGGLAPERRGDLARFGLRAVLGGSIATFMTATIAGVLTWFG
jgi:CNT family concentrative nucleoside transporter